MADVLKNLVVPQKLAHIRPRRYKHGSIEPSSRKSQQGGGNKSQIYPLTVKETCACYTRTTSLNATSEIDSKVILMGHEIVKLL